MLYSSYIKRYNIKRYNIKTKTKNKKTGRVHVKWKFSDTPVQVYGYPQCCSKPVGEWCGFHGYRSRLDLTDPYYTHVPP